MSLLPDPQDLRAVAARIGAAAESARAEASRLQAQVGAAVWHGAAATAFDLLAGDVIAGLRASADRLDDAADALRRHAANVEHTLTTLLQAGSDVLAIGGGLIHGMVDEVVHPSRLIGDAASVIGDAGSLAHHVGELVGIG
jgi:WXG100 family type VII secretion target